VLRVVAITVALNKLVSSIPTTVGAGRIHRLPQRLLLPLHWLLQLIDTSQRHLHPNKSSIAELAEHDGDDTTA